MCVETSIDRPNIVDNDHFLKKGTFDIKYIYIR